MKAVYLLALSVIFLASIGCEPEKTMVTEPQPPAITSTASAETPVETRPAERSELNKQNDSTAAPQMTVEKPVHDFGDLGPGQRVSTRFAFTNTGNAVLKIERFHAPCGCTVPDLPKRDYAPGESGDIQVRYSAPSGAAVDRKPIYVYTNDPENPQFELTVKARVVVNVEVNPTEVSLSLDQDNAGMPALTVKSTDGKEFAITNITVTNNVAQIPFSPNKRAAEFVLTPDVDLQRLENTHNGVIQIHTDHPQAGVLRTRFSSRPLFDISHPRIILQNVVPGEVIIREVWIRSNYDDRVEIDTYFSTNGYMTITDQKRDGNHLQITVKITPPTDVSPASRRYITDELKIELTNGQVLSIRCSGWFKLN